MPINGYTEGGYDAWLERPYQNAQKDEDACPDCEGHLTRYGSDRVACPECGFEDERDYEREDW